MAVFDIAGLDPKPCLGPFLQRASSGLLSRGTFAATQFAPSEDTAGFRPNLSHIRSTNNSSGAISRPGMFEKYNNDDNNNDNDSNMYYHIDNKSNNKHNNNNNNYTSELHHCQELCGDDFCLNEAKPSAAEGPGALRAPSV